MPQVQKITSSEVAKHALAEDCWIVVNGKVYDLTKFAPNHPGGAEIIHQFAGKDGTKTYNMYHSKELIEKELVDEDKKGDFDESSIDSKWTDANKEDESAKSPLDPEQKPPLAALINADDFERSFEKYGPRKPWAYITGASNDLLTYDANKTCWHKLWFRPRIMRDVKAITTRTKMLGQEVTMPLLIAPMGIAKTAGDEGELALGAGAARGGIIHVQSTAASFSVEDILAAVPKTHPYFFQLYVDRNRKKTEELLQRLETMDQIKAIFVTVDLPVVSKREADERVLEEQKVSLYSGDGVTNKPDKKGGGLARTTGGFIEWQLTWNDLPWIKRFTSKPIVIKGIQTAADAKLALELGCAGIVVSNHGGRALDNAPATLLSLLEIRRDCPEVFTRMEVYVDGGVRRGSDILKAVMIGAQGVGVGRPFQCAVAYNTNGVEHLCDIFQDELETAMRLCGVTDLNKVRGDMQYLNTSELDQFLPPKPQTGLFGFLRSKL
ncbi:FMN-dependent dehydrogenase-domain-containing protein [Neohortaea acidophila]|uniref:FMN-dependent dehydrogenase-domain-containing protein n=1 Tax=Neohortaea acidophila TaxID=245834 RepID=A0A6A6PQW3_9PEZI|nr:FMN-dependent dehydrogenase-domain-containing protein [Neohortaea acidophila]KAF2482081.1 FMN-dependent dehydrogenase-domain-containing protein [Neohortaea acidophila]